jgi:hypothetical protein
MSEEHEESEQQTIRIDEPINIVEISRQEAQRTLDNQFRTLSDIDDKAARILRINLILLGIVLTGISIATDSGSGAGSNQILPELANQYTVSGVTLLVLSTAVAAITYTSSDFRGGMGGSDLRSILDNEYSDRDNLEGLVESYSRWIDHNYRTNLRNAPLGTLTLLLLVYALAALALGTRQALGTVRPRLLGGTFIALVTVTWSTRFHRQLSRYYRAWNARRGEDSSSSGTNGES